MNTELERMLAEANHNIFLREFTFASTIFTDETGQQRELADHIVLMPGAILAFQAKERSALADSSDAAMETWFKRKVLQKACGQLADTEAFFHCEPSLSLPNQRGHVQDLSGPSAPVIKVAIYWPSGNWPASLARTSHKQSARAGFVHILHARDYFEVCRILALPVEIAEYFRHRETFLLGNPAWEQGEARLLAAFIMEDLEGDLDDDTVKAVLRDALEDVRSFHLGNMLRKFGEVQFAYGGGATADYYAILDEFAHMNRVQMRGFRRLLDWALKKMGGAFPERPARMLVENKGMGIVVFPVHQGGFTTRLDALRNYTLAAKHDWKLDRQIGVSVARSGPDIQIDWAFLSEPWGSNVEMDQRLAANYPFREAPDPKLDYRFRGPHLG